MASSVQSVLENHGQREALQQRLTEFAEGLTSSQLSWASGFLGALAEQTRPTQSPSANAVGQSDSDPQIVWRILFATETGNSQGIAQEIAQQFQNQGFLAEAVDLSTYRARQLQKETHTLFVVATHGLGDVPEGTQEFFEVLFGDFPGTLNRLQYSVLALGDSSYADFCRVGQLLDDRLQELGAKRLAARVDCDVDFESLARDWQQGVLKIAREQSTEDVPGPTLVAPVSEIWSRGHPFSARVLTNQRITGRTSSKAVHHVELDLEGSGINHRPGDSLGIWPTNPAMLVQPILKYLHLDGSRPVVVEADTLPLEDALKYRLELSQLGAALLRRYAQRFEIPALLNLLKPDNTAGLHSFLARHQLIDLLQLYPVQMDEQELVNLLGRLTPRLYSIASSAMNCPEEAHLTVSLVQYEAFGQTHVGASSTYLSHLQITPVAGSTKPADASGERVPVYVVPNRRFRLPSDPNRSIVMIGAGTGIAPFRAFLQERQSLGASGKNWLIFGDRNFRSDFLYQLEWARYRKTGLLTRHDVAFSRDQNEKVYVQNRLRQHAVDLLEWIAEGATLYLCGDAASLAPAVDSALVEVLADDGKIPLAEAESLLGQLKREGRYQRDVY